MNDLFPADRDLQRPQHDTAARRRALVIGAALMAASATAGAVVAAQIVGRAGGSASVQPAAPFTPVPTSEAPSATQTTATERPTATAPSPTTGATTRSPSRWQPPRTATTAPTRPVSPSPTTMTTPPKPQVRGHIAWTLNRSPNPSTDEADAYARITAAMDAAVARWNRLSDVTRQITVNYNPGVPTAQGSSNGTIDFGANRGYMQEGTALHEMAHVMGVGQSGGWWANGGGSGTWAGARATALLRRLDGPGAVISTGGGHFWPYGLNHANEYNEQAFDRNVRVVTAMMADGL